MPSRRSFCAFVVFTVCLLAGTGLSAPATRVHAATPVVVDSFESGLPAGHDANNIAIGFNTFQDPNSSVAITTTAAPPAPVPAAGNPNHVLQVNLNVVSFAGVTHSFEDATVTQWVSQDWSAYAGISLWVYGNNSGTTMFLDVLDNRNPGSTKDDAERWSIDIPDNFSGWQQIQVPFASMHRKEIGNGAPNDGFGLTQVHGWAFGTTTTPAAQVYYLDDVTVYGSAPVRPLTVAFSTIDYKVTEGGTATVTVILNRASSTPVTVQYKTTIGPAIASRDYIPVASTLTFPPGITQQSFSVITIDDKKYQGERGVQVELSNPSGGAALGLPPVARVDIQDNESYDPRLLDDFETYPYLWKAADWATLTNPEIAASSPLVLPGQGPYEHVLQAQKRNSNFSYDFSRTFPIGQDWSQADGLNFWYYGQNSGRVISVNLANNVASSADPSKWKLIWSDEFNGKAGAAPNGKVWGNEVGDGVATGNPGWGNNELEYYTANPANAATDGSGNLVITTKAADGSQQCYYGPCQYTSARLLTKNRFEVAYGRVEARMKVARGSGLWPAFWMLGTNIDQVNWPQAGEIDIMENVGRLPNQVFGTLHGPGYAGGQSYGKSDDLGKPVADDFHTFAVEWQPNKITWFVDGVQYFTATPSDPFLAGKQWVFNHPFFLLLNVAVGGNFGGPVGPDTVFPQTTLVDYVRLYQAPPKLESFSQPFLDNFQGWKQVSLPFSGFSGRTGTKLDRTAVRSISFDVQAGVLNPVRLDQLRLYSTSTPPTPTSTLPTPTATSTSPTPTPTSGGGSGWSTITFDDPAVVYTLTDFGGDASSIVTDPAGGTNKVAQVIKTAGAASWAGTTLSTGPNFSVPALPFTASNTKMTARVWSPDAGIPIRLKAENASDPTKSVETEATVTTAAGWQTLTFDFAHPAPGTAPLNLGYTYNKVSIFFNFGTDGATAGAKTYYVDDVAFAP